MNELAVVDNYCQLTKTALVFKREVSKSEWQSVFDALNHIEGCVQFWIGDCLKYREQKWGMYDDVIELSGYNKGTLQNIKYIADRIESSLRNEDLTFNHHKEVAKLEPEKQKFFLDKASNEKLTTRELRAEIKKETQKEIKLPDNKYKVIYADPPWEYNDKQDTDKLGGAVKHYNTMTIEELCAMPINDISSENSILFLWVTSPLLEDSFKVINAWGFTYKTSFIWDKIDHNMGHYNSVRHEFLLVCTKGSCTPEVVKLFDSVQSIKRTDKHSEKPEEFRNIIDALYPSGNRIELFARKKVQNWEVWGDDNNLYK